MRTMERLFLDKNTKYQIWRYGVQLYQKADKDSDDHSFLPENGSRNK